MVIYHCRGGGMKKEKININYTEYETYIPESLKNRRTIYKAVKDKKKISTFIPGTISSIFVKEGDKVQIGQKLLILEAMKMENEILSPVEGIIKKIYIKKGDTTKKDQLLIEIE